MPYSRKKVTFKRGRFARRRRFYSRRSRVGRQVGPKIHYFKRVYKQTVTVTGDADKFVALLSADAGGYNRFRLSDCPNYTDFTNLYDSYKICGIKRKYVWDKNGADAEDNTVQEIPRLITVNDFNDISAPANENEMLEYASCKITRLSKVTKRYFTPSIVINDAGQGNFQVQKRQWFDCATGADQNHSGLKEALITTSTDPDADLGTLYIYTTLYLAFRSPR